MKVVVRKDEIVKDYEYLQSRLVEDIEIDLSGKKSAVIFGFNGIGKTSIYNYLREIDKEGKRDYIEYGDSQNEFIKMKNKLIISPYVVEINNKKSKIKQVSDQIDVRQIINDSFNIGTIKKAEPYGARVVEARRSNVFSGFENLMKDIDAVINSIKFIRPDHFIKLMPKFKTVNNVEKELNHALMEKTKYLIENAIPIIEELDNNICPLCDTKHENLEELVKDRFLELKNVKSKVYFELEKLGYRLTEKEFTILLEQVKLLNNDKDLLQDYILCGGNKDTRVKLNKKYNSIKNLNKEIEMLEKKSEEMYSNLLGNKEKIISDFQKYFGVDKENVLFNDIDYVVEIRLPRDSKNYSTGEKNLMFFLYELYSFIGSEKQVLVLDDPVSSLDIINHYKIAYELIKLLDNTNKRVLVLTHSIEFINTLNSQHPKYFNYYYLEDDGKMKLQNINLNSLNNLITLPNLLDEFDETKDLQIIRALIKKEHADQTEKIHKVFHYYPDKYHDCETGVSNHDLVQKIENFEDLEDSGCFKTNSINKIVTVASMRVWIEKQLYELIEDPGLKETFLLKEQLMARIGVVLPRNRNPKIKISNNLTREYIVGQKVFLNQGIHYQSQVMPFAYSINMSIRELNEQVKEVKNVFASSV